MGNINYSYGYVMSQKLPVGDFKWVKKRSKFNLGFIKNYNEGMLNEASVQYHEKLCGLHDNKPFLSQRIKIGNVEKLIGNLQDKKIISYTTQVRTLKNH